MWTYLFNQDIDHSHEITTAPILVNIEFSRSTYGAFRPYHAHDEYHLLFCTRGSGILRLIDSEIKLSAGKLVLIPAKMIHGCGPGENGMEFWGISFASGGKDDILCDFFKNTGLFSASFIGYLEYVRGCFQLLHDFSYHQSSPEIQEQTIRCHTMSLIHFARAMFLSHPIMEEQPRQNPMLIVMQWIIDHYAEDITLNSLAREFSISSSHLSRRFYQAFHISPINYLIDYRITMAKDLLLYTDLPVHEIAARVGYENAYHFSNLFSKRTGSTPQELRAHMRHSDTQPVPADFSENP